MISRHKLIASVVALAIATTAFASDYYRVNVTRKDRDLYKDNNSGVYIVTRFCHEYVYAEDAILKWNGFDGKLIFDSGWDCEVKSLLSK